MRLSATDLRSRLYAVLDRIAETGEAVEILRKGRTLRIIVEQPQAPRFSMSKLVARPGVIVGDPDELVATEWSRAWSPFTGEIP